MITESNKSSLGVWRTLLALCVLCGSISAADTLVPFGATWSYRDIGTFPGSTWNQPLYNDAAWASGPAELGYGDGDEATVVSFGPDPDDKYTTTHFRHTFNVANPAAYDGLILQLVRDDGAAVYLNGVEVLRSNLPAGPIGFNTFATSTAGGSEEEVSNYAVIAPDLLVAGSNVLAAEVHQRDSDSSDISFNLELVGHTPSDPVNVLRGPYLQQLGRERAVVRWRTDAFVSSRVGIGSTPGSIDTFFANSTLTSDHEIEVIGLTEGTTYHYAVGDDAAWFAGPDTDHQFSTAPDANSTAPVRIWAIGDSGTADASAAAVRNAYLAQPGADETDVWLMLGDNAYDAGTDNEYQLAVFDMYPTLLRRTSVWPTLGNHDGRTASITGEGPYYDMFTLPTAAENGGLASGTEAYYSFDYANVHIVCLDSEGTSLAPSSAMATWLESDLASTDREWIIAFWHHPPYTDGSHTSDDPSDSSGRLFDVRENLLPILEDGGVDLVLCGHSHSYERSYLIDGHYGVSSTLSPTMVLDGGDGDPTGDGAYAKPEGIASHEGAVYIVAGSSGKIDTAPLAHAAMHVGVALLGSVVIDVQGPQLDARFLRHTGTVFDTFRIVKAPQFIRADANGDGALNVADPIAILDHLFQSVPVACQVALDVNDDESIDIADTIAALSTLFSGGPAPAAPYPSCGIDPTAGALSCDVSPCP